MSRPERHLVVARVWHETKAPTSPRRPAQRVTCGFGSGGERTRTADFYVAKVVEVVWRSRRHPFTLVRKPRPSEQSTASTPLAAFRCQTVANLRPLTTGYSRDVLPRVWSRTTGSVKEHTRPSQRPAIALIESLQLTLRAVRGIGGRAFDLLQTHLEALRLALDPSTRRWVDDAHRSLADGSFKQRVEHQPSPRELAEQLKRERQHPA